MTQKSLYLILLYVFIDCIQKFTFNKLRVAFNNAYLRVLSLPWRSSANAMHANFGFQIFEAVIRKSTFRFYNDYPKTPIFLLWL